MLLFQAAESGATTLGGLTDVTITNPVAGQGIFRNSANTAWINQAPASWQVGTCCIIASFNILTQLNSELCSNDPLFSE